MVAESIVPFLPQVVRRVPVRRWFLFLLPLAPLLYLLFLVDRHGVDVPYADEFSVAPFRAKAHSNTITFADLWAQHNEHRYFIPRLIFIAFDRLAHGDQRAEMFFSVFLAGVVGILLLRLIRRTVASSVDHALLLLAAVTLLLFSPVQAENWMWGFQFVLLLANLYFVSSVLVVASPIQLPLKFCLCALLAIAATCSFGNGMLLWVLSFPAAVVLHRITERRWHTAWLAGWSLIALFTISVYFVGFHRPAQVPTAGGAGLFSYCAYVAAFLGAHLARAHNLESLVPPLCLGIILLSTYAAAAWYALQHLDEREFLARLFPWFCLGAYSILTACLAAVGRIGFGVHQALDSRYTCFSLYLSISVLGLVAIISPRLIRATGSSSRAYIQNAKTALLTVFLLSSLTAYVWGAQSMKTIEQSRRTGKAALLFANVLDSGQLYEKHLIANASAAKEGANLLDQAGLLHPRLFGSPELKALRVGRPAKGGPPTDDPAGGRMYHAAGYIDSLQTIGSLCRLTGWSLLPSKARVADCVVVGYKTNSSSAIVFRVADQSIDRPDVAQLFGLDDVRWCGWRLEFDRSLIAENEVTLAAWAVDSDTGRLFQLSGEPPLK